MKSNKKLHPINVFIHVPKTAGSTVNDYLERSSTHGASHIEAWINDDAVASKKMLHLDWVSGHVQFPQMRARLAANTARHLRFFTLVRDPIKQLMSHYNWLIEIYHRGDAFYNGHPQRIKEISQAIRASNNDDPKIIIRQISAASGLFLNQQSRIVLGDLNHIPSKDEFFDRLTVYDHIATESSLPHFVKHISGLQYEDTRRANVSPYHFDRNVFESKLMQEFVADRHAMDLALYRHLKDREAQDIV